MMRLLFATLLALAVLLVASTAVQAGYDSVTGDYAYIDGPYGGDFVTGKLLLEGRAGNDMATPFIGSETSPLIDDPNRDANMAYELLPTSVAKEMPRNTTGTDVGNVWVNYDDGDEFQVSFRLYENPWQSTDDASVAYYVQFRHVPTDVLYRVDAKLIAGSGWQFGLSAFDDGGLGWCNAAASSADSDFNTEGLDGSGYSQFVTGGGGVITWVLPYQTLNLTAAPVTPGCSVSTGPGVAIGDNLVEWYGFSTHRVGGGVAPVGATFKGDNADETDGGGGTGIHTLGPAAPAPTAPYGPIQVTVNGVDAGTTTSLGPDLFFHEVDLSKFFQFDCMYYIKVEYGSASDVRAFREAGCTPSTHLVPFSLLLLSTEGQSTRDPLPATSTRTLSYSDDQDLDGRPDRDDQCTYLHRERSVDQDGDGIADDCDADRDGDGLDNGVDNCPATANEDQRDTDHNGVGDACETDLDGDGWSDALDNCFFDANPAQADLDQDGVGNICDDDADGDGVANDADAFPLDGREWADTDGDGIGDNADPDADNDGFSNEAEIGFGSDPLDASSKPFEGNPYETRAVAPAQEAGIGAVGSIGVALALLVVGVVLFALMRPRPE